MIREMGYVSPRIGFGKYFVEFSVFDALRKTFPGAEIRRHGDELLQGPID